MSLTVAEAPAPVKTLAISPEDMANFEALHGPAAKQDIQKVLHKIQPGKRFRLVITPMRALVREECSSFVREDFTTPGCEHSIMMRVLYRKLSAELCPEGMELSFDYETQGVYIDDHRVEITMMVMYFFVPGRRTRAPRKSR